MSIIRLFGHSFVALTILAGPALADNVTPIPPPCSINTTATTRTDYSGNVTTSSAVLIPAPRQGVTRTGIFIQCLAATCTLAINLSGGTASTSVAGNMVCTGYLCGFNSAALGFTPQGSITAIADGTRAVTAYACP